MSNGSGLTPGPTGALDLDSEEGRAFLQERLALFGMVGFLVQFGFFALSWLVLSFVVPELVFGRWPLAQIGMVAGDLLGQGLYLLLWLYARRGRRKLVVLRFLDILLPLLTCSASALALPGKRVGYGAPFAILLIIMTALMARAVIVPSSPKRTLKLGLACVLPLLVTTAGLRLPTPIFGPQVRDLPFLVPGVMWSACAVILSTFTSAVIFGLRRRVSEARRLGQYTLEHKLGEGGMGAVYRARHAMLRRPTAIKLLPPERSGARSLQRFEREVQTTALLSHPNTVAIYDYGRTPDGVFYYTMEYLEGIDLDGLVRSFGPQHPGRVVHILRQVAGALGEAHGVGLIHRDVKPGNIILCERGGVPDVAKVVDFGLVRDLSADPQQMTRSGLDLVTGTPLYLSPEAITAPEKVDARSDLYALGAVGYYLLAGRHPFEGATVVEVCTHHLHTRPERPSARLGAPLPAELEDVILACLEKDPARRPQSALALDLRLEGMEERTGWGEREAHEWWRRNGAQVAQLRQALEATRSSLPTFAVRLEERLAAGAEGAEGAGLAAPDQKLKPVLR